MLAYRPQHTALLVGLVLVASFAHALEGQDSATLNEVVDLNKKALVAYQKVDVTKAGDLLMQALTLCEHAGLANHPAAARTHIHLGVVYVSGLKKHAEGLAEFKRALAIDPKITVTKSLLNPEVQAAFDEAKATSPTASPPGTTPPSPTSQASAKPGSSGPSRRQDWSIHHPPVTRAIRGRPVTVKVQVPPGLGASKVMLAYRAKDSDLFLARDMVEIEATPGWFEAEIPSEATQGTRVDYYLEAQSFDDQTIASSGSPEMPHQVTLAPEVSPRELPPRELAAAAEVKQPTTNFRAALWLVFAFGGGGGYYSGTPEMNPVDTSTPPQPIHVSGVGLAGLGHLAPEVGYFASDRLVLSAQGRLQYVTGGQDVVLGPRTYHPAKLALAGLAKLTWLLRDPRNKLLPFVNAQVGAGQIRHGITTPSGANLTGCGSGSTCEDTVVGGLGLAGLGAGIAWMLSPGLGAYAAVNVLVGFPDFMVNGDLNVGIAVLR